MLEKKDEMKRKKVKDSFDLCPLVDRITVSSQHIETLNEFNL